MNREVNFSKRIKTPQGLQYCRVVLSANGPHTARLGFRQRPGRETSGAYYLEWRGGNKRIRLSIGKDAATATSRRLQKDAELNATNNGILVVPQNGSNGQPSRLVKTNHPRTADSFRLVN